MPETSAILPSPGVAPDVPVGCQCAAEWGPCPRCVEEAGPPYETWPEDDEPMVEE